MQKKMAVTLFVVLSICVSLMAIPADIFAAEGKRPGWKGGEYLPGYFIITDNLPHVFLLVMTPREPAGMNLSKDQTQRLNVLKRYYVGIIMRTIKTIKVMEAEVTYRVYVNLESPDKVKELVDEIERRRRELTDLHIECIIETRKVFTEKQWAMILEAFSITKASKKKAAQAGKKE